MTQAKHIGGSILPSSDSQILQPIAGRHGTLQVRPCPELDMYGLFYTHSKGESVLAMHANGYSCHNLAKRLIDVWEGWRETGYAIAQYDYILSCGGLGCSRESLEYIAASSLRYAD